ncbi:hypothetical protein ACE02P_05000 [Shewanella bicestrii]
MKIKVKWTDIATAIATWTIAVLVLLLLLQKLGLSLQTMSAEVWVAISAAFIALCALAVSIHQIRLSEQHDRLSVKPCITLIRHLSGTDKIGLELINNGFGPAVIKSITVKRGVKTLPYQSLEAVSLLLCLDYEKIKTQHPEDIHYTFLGDSNILGTGHSLWLIYNEQPTDELRNKWKKALNAIELSAEYESIYRDETFQENYTL